MLRSAAVAAALAILYFLTAKLTGWLVGDPAVFWPASGVYLGAMLVAPRRLWSVLACAAGAGSLLTYLDGGASLELSIAFAVPSAAEGLLAAVLVERLAGERLRLTGVRDLRALVVGAAVATGLVALSAAAVAAQSFDASFAESWLRWWSADTLGMLAIVPIFTAAGWELRATALGALGVSIVAAHAGSDVYTVQAFLAVLLTSALGLAASTGDHQRLRGHTGRSEQQHELERRRKAADHASYKLETSAERHDRATRRIAQLTAELAARSVEVDEATRRGERLAAELRESQAARELTEQQLADARSELARASSEHSALEEQLSRMRSENGALEEELSRAGTQHRALEDELSRVSGESIALEDELSRAGTQNRALEEALSRAGRQNGALEEEVARVGSRNRALEEELSRARTACAALQREIDRRESEQDRVGEQLAKAVADLRRAEDELAAGRADDVRAELQQAQRAHEQTMQALEQARALLLEERKRAEESLDELTATLARTEAERRLLADHATELIARYDERGMCLYASPASRRLLGYEPDELAGHPGAELLHPDDRHLLARARATRSETTFQGRLRRKTGDYIWVEVLLRPVLARDGDRPVAITATIRAISRDRDLAAA